MLKETPDRVSFFMGEKEMNGSLHLFDKIIEKAEARIEAAPSYDALALETAGDPAGPGHTAFYLGRNIPLLKRLAAAIEAGERDPIRFVYIDPPFFSENDYDAVVTAGDQKLKFTAYTDRWSDGLEDYLVKAACVLVLIRRVLAADGLVCVHLDWHVSHYVRALMDEVFGADRFVNDIVWTYKSGGSTTKRFSRKHDDLLLYSKSKEYRFNPQKEKSYNRGGKPYRFDGVDEFEDENGWYTLVNMKDVWDIDMVGRTSGERTGYATQKPLKLMRRLIVSCSDEGDTVADFFAGSGAFPLAAAELGRNVIACDVSPLSADTTMRRLEKAGAFVDLYADNAAEDTAQDAFDAEVSAVREKGTVTVTVDAIAEPGLADRLDGKSLAAAEELLAHAPERLIKSVSAGSAGPDGVFYKVKEAADACSVSFDASEIEGPVVVKVTDVFGNFTYKSVS